jgi:hypothetical protein
LLDFFQPFHIVGCAAGQPFAETLHEFVIRDFHAFDGGLVLASDMEVIAIELELAYKMAGLEGNNFSLTWTFHEVYLPRPRIPVSGPGGVQASFNWQGVYDDALTKSVTVVLKNDVTSYP